MQIIYFVADKTQPQITADWLKSIGLGYAFDTTPVFRGVQPGKGPEGRSGGVIGRSEKGLSYLPNAQTWKPLIGVENVWVGISKTEPPTARELVRSDWINPIFDNDIAHDPNLLVIDSHDLAIGGKFWPIPIARAWSLTSDVLNAKTKLPCTVEYGLDSNGKKTFFVGDPILKFKRLEEIAATVQKCWVDGELPDSYYELCAEVLSLVYHIGPQEMAMLEIVTSDIMSCANLLWLVIDNIGFREMFKKKQVNDSTQTGSGNAA